MELYTTFPLSTPINFITLSAILFIDIALYVVPSAFVTISLKLDLFPNINLSISRIEVLYLFLFSSLLENPSLNLIYPDLESSSESSIVLSGFFVLESIIQIPLLAFNLILNSSNERILDAGVPGNKELGFGVTSYPIVLEPSAFVISIFFTS